MGVNAREEGRVAEWNRKGYGFIHFEDGRRAYVHNIQCGGQALDKGEVVTCVLVEDAKNPGKYAAHDVERIGRGGQRTDDSAALYAQLSAELSGGEAPLFADNLSMEDRKEGVVAQWSDRGFGFINFPDGTRAYVHNSACGGEHLQNGETVTCVVVPDSKNPGKLSARDVRRGPDGEDGTVTDWNDGKGFGFVLLDDSRRCYVHRTHLGGFGSLYVGQRLRVAVGEDPRNPGKWSVSEVKGELAAPAQAAGGARGSSAPPVVGNPIGAGHAAASGRSSGKGKLPGEQGEVVEWIEEKGYGFMLMDSGQKVYLHRSFIGEHAEVTIGMRFQVTLKPDKRNPGKLSVDEFLGMVAAPAGGVAGAVEAVVTEWKSEGGYGFVELGDGRKAYVHRSFFGETGDLTIGEQLQVTVGPDERNPGKWRVLEIVGATPHMSDTVDGVVAEWKEDGGYGFINLDDGRRAYIHRSFLGGAETLVNGQRLRVTLKPDDRNPGKFSVQSILGELVEEGTLPPEKQPVKVPRRLPPKSESVDAGSSEGGDFGATVSEWREKEGWGLVTLDDGRRCYIHRSNFGERGNLIPNSRLEVSIKPDPRNPGKWAVDEVLDGDVVLRISEVLSLDLPPPPKRQRL
eukprot:TRINITY_DN80457_c0_g1_i1.p1 TRINITY_DN80457_c0_g1~~TRINITY_DN80457_c0_g1_i1.p1  ORF type:complete len:626 (+),score=101.87 TRINITY_DN80457_c0_g1_i1:112-1989(+)